jgi:hypothetical protein
MKTELSPAAQAVKDAALAMYADCNVRRIAWPLDMPVVAATLRAAADQVVPAEDEDAHLARWSFTEHMMQRQNTRRKLLAIANELEAQP